MRILCRKPFDGSLSANTRPFDKQVSVVTTHTFHDFAEIHNLSRELFQKFIYVRAKLVDILPPTLHWPDGLLADASNIDESNDVPIANNDSSGYDEAPLDDDFVVNSRRTVATTTFSDFMEAAKNLAVYHLNDAPYSDSNTNTYAEGIRVMTNAIMELSASRSNSIPHERTGSVSFPDHVGQVTKQARIKTPIQTVLTCRAKPKKKNSIKSKGDTPSQWYNSMSRVQYSFHLSLKLNSGCYETS
jgi:hypothetical protein